MNDRLIARIASDEVMDAAYAHVRRARVERAANDDIWHLRFHWQRLKGEMKNALLAGKYRFSPCRAVRVDGHSLGLWNAADAVVQKAMTMVLSAHLSSVVSPSCYHVQGRGGMKAAVREAAACADGFGYVLKSDVRSYYASIDHAIVLAQLRPLVEDAAVLRLIGDFLAHLDDVGGELLAVQNGISKGSSLSPLLGAIYLQSMDQRLGAYAQRHGLRYFRFMDDWLLLCKTRRQLRVAVRISHEVLAALKLDKAPDKTYIGKLAKGIDFLGYHFGRCASEGVAIAEKTWSNHQDTLTRLYEQGASLEGLREYGRRWRIWARSGVRLVEGWAKGFVFDEFADEDLLEIKLL